MRTATVTKSVEFDAGHRVPLHVSKCRNPHGHRYRVVAHVDGPIVEDPTSSDDGMVVDFGVLKSVLTREVHDRFDHGFIVAGSDREMRDALDGFGWKVIVLHAVPTAENLAVECFRTVSDALPPGLVLQAIEVYETPTSVARFAR